MSRQKPTRTGVKSEADLITSAMTLAWGATGRWDKCRNFALLHDEVAHEIRGPVASASPRDVADALVRLGWTAADFTAAVSSSANRPNGRRRQSNPSADDSSPYSDPSRDVGEGPDGITRTQSVLISLALLVGIYVASASCGTSDPPPVEHRCHICQEFTSGGGDN